MRCLHDDRDCTSSSDAVAVREHLLSRSACNGGSSPQDLIDYMQVDVQLHLICFLVNQILVGAYILIEIVQVQGM